MRKCAGCGKIINGNFDKACYSKYQNVYLCSEDCLFEYAYEWLNCIPLDENGDLFIGINGKEELLEDNPT